MAPPGPLDESSGRRYSGAMMFSTDSDISAGGAAPRRIAFVALFAVTMAYFEAAVVVYLRAIAYPEGFAFPLAGIDPFIAATEVGREAASLLMILAVAFLAGRGRAQRLAVFLIVFGIWDIFYYLFLKLLLGWPASLLTWDVLFLIPVVWAAPVIAPAAAAALMILLGLAILRGDRRMLRASTEAVLPEEAIRRHGFRLARREVLLLAGAGLLLFASFIGDFLIFALPQLGKTDGQGSVTGQLSVLGMQYEPAGFPWAVYGAGMVLLAGCIVSVIRRVRSGAKLVD
jgi:hypothetical protein